MIRRLTILLCFCLPLAALQAQTDSSSLPDGAILSETHRFLAVYEGTWTEEISTWKTADAEPEKSTVTAVINMAMQNHHWQCAQTGEIGGSSFEALFTLGYESSTGKFTLTQISTETTATWVLDGPWKEPALSILLNGNGSREGKAIPVQEMITFDDKDNFRIEVLEPDEHGGSFKSREYHFSRQ